jgi:hypothetical protein
LVYAAFRFERFAAGGALSYEGFDVAAGLGPEVQLTRTQTIMQGASHCDFRYRRT